MRLATNNAGRVVELETNNGKRIVLDRASIVKGFGDSLNKDDANRIDRMVNTYQNRILDHLNEEYVRTTKWSDRLADNIAKFGGSWRFIVIFSSFLVLWLLWNTLFAFRFDPPPFILLNLILSFIASFQAPIIMMSQNRQAARDKHEAIIDFAINYKAEHEIDDVQAHLHRMEADISVIKGLLQQITLTSEAKNES